jgi:hypothetical protein
MQMKTHILLTCTLSKVFASSNIYAKRPYAEEHRFSAFISGAVVGGGLSNLTAIRGHIQNMVFNKANSARYDFTTYFRNIVEYDQGGDGSSCFAIKPTGTMQMYDDFQADGLMARFWFRARSNDDLDEVSYVLELFDTDWQGDETSSTWSGNFPPLGNDGVISRTAESWSMETTKKKVKNACTGSGDFDELSQYVRVDLECATCQ